LRSRAAGDWLATLLLIVVVAATGMTADDSPVAVVRGILLLLTLPVVLHRRVDAATVRIRCRRPHLPAPPLRD
jgi:hypothetical protein